MQMRDAPKTRARILRMAESLFSERGFDGTRVDDIAKEAGVNKALIYYYFKSKDEILETLFVALLEEVKQVLIKTVEGTLDIAKGDNLRQLFEAYMDFMSSKRKIIKVAIGESVKTSSNLSMIMKVGGLLINAEVKSIRKAYENKGLHFAMNEQELLVMEFFTGFMPLISYALYRDEWEKFYSISKEDLREQFSQSFKKTHLAAHLIDTNG
jgi:TetR/AcrR family transcriptional regulator